MLRKWRTGALIAALVAIFVALLLILRRSDSTASAVAATAELFGAVATAVAAIAAYRAARASSDAARDARDALGNGLRPTLSLGVGGEAEGHFAVGLDNYGYLDAADVYLEARFSDGVVLRAGPVTLPGNPLGGGGLSLNLPITSSDTAGYLTFIARGGADLVARYRDSRHIAEWEQVWSFSSGSTPDLTGMQWNPGPPRKL